MRGHLSLALSPWGGEGMDLGEREVRGHLSLALSPWGGEGMNLGNNNNERTK